MAVLHKEVIEVSANAVRAAYRERREFEADRVGTNGYPGAKPSRMTYMAHAKGYVMTRHPGCTPFVVTEDEWRAMPLWQKPASDHL